MNFRKISVTLLSCLLLAGCGASTTQEETSVTSSETTPTLAETTETTVYVPGGEGSYIQMDHGIGTEVQDQGYTPLCWAYATRDILRIAYQTSTGNDLDITVPEIQEIAYGEKVEGLQVREGETVNSVAGGVDTYVLWTLANGYNGYTVVENPCLNNTFIDENDGHFMTNAATIEQMQDMIMNKGALPVYIKADGGILLYKDFCLMNDDSSWDGDEMLPVDGDYLGHEALIVGWDDNFPKEYFGQYGRRTPTTDGAWLYKDSAGTTWGNEGYAWLSYESSFIVNGYITVSDKYSEVASYENGATVGFNTGDKTTVANVFHHEGKLAAVGTYVGVTNEFGGDVFYGMQDEDHSITIEIRDADLNEVLCTKTVDFDFDGYYVVELDEPVDVEDFAVVITYSGNVPAEGETEEAHPPLYYYAGSNPGESFVLYNGEWLDTSDPSIKDTLGLEELPNNCCIKALFVE